MKPKQTRKSPLVTFSLTPEAMDALRDLAAGAGLSLSATIRLLILEAKKKGKQL